MHRFRNFLSRSLPMAILVLATNGLGQDIFLKGKLIDDKSLPVNHAYVALAKLKIGDSTDINGFFEIRNGSFTSIMAEHTLLKSNANVFIKNQSLIINSDIKLSRISFRISNMLGATVYSLEQKNIQSGRYTINFSEICNKQLANGVYIMHLSLNGQKYSMKYLNTAKPRMASNFSQSKTSNQQLAKQLAAINDTLIIYVSGSIYNKIPIITYVDSVISIYSNQAPKCTNLSTLPDSIYNGFRFFDTLLISDPNSDRVAFTVLSKPTACTITSVTGGDNISIDWKPGLADTGDYTISIVLKDYLYQKPLKGGVDTVTWKFTVRNKYVLLPFFSSTLVPIVKYSTNKMNNKRQIVYPGSKEGSIYLWSPDTVKTICSGVTFGSSTFIIDLNDNGDVLYGLNQYNGGGANPNTYFTFFAPFNSNSSTILPSLPYAAYNYSLTNSGMIVGQTEHFDANNQIIRTVFSWINGTVTVHPAIARMNLQSNPKVGYWNPSLNNRGTFICFDTSGNQCLFNPVQNTKVILPGSMYFGSPFFTKPVTWYLINDSNVVVGQYTKAQTTGGTALWRDGVVNDLGTLGGTIAFDGSYPIDMNNNNIILGFSYDAAKVKQVVLWVDNNIVRLDKLLGQSLPVADNTFLYINDNCDILFDNLLLTPTEWRKVNLLLYR